MRQWQHGVGDKLGGGGGSLVEAAAAARLKAWQQPGNGSGSAALAVADILNPSIITSTGK